MLGYWYETVIVNSQQLFSTNEPCGNIVKEIVGNGSVHIEFKEVKAFAT